MRTTWGRCLIVLAMIGSSSAFSPPSLTSRPLLAGSASARSISCRRRGIVRMVGAPEAAAAAASPIVGADKLISIVQKGDVAALQAALVGHETQVAAASAALLFLVGVIASQAGETKPGNPYPIDNTYDQKSAAQYFAARPGLVASRTAELLLNSGTFGLSILFDKATGSIDTNMPTRARELTTLLTKLGPTFIKIGQSLSIRTDLLPPPYIEALQQLQDKVPAFDTEIALRTIEEEFGKPAASLFDGIQGMKPIAAASLGQVYKAQIASGPNKGTSVAVKIQRPDILERVALDMHLIRLACPTFKFVTGYPGDAEGLVDDWGKGFVNELDYQEEAVNGKFFNEAILKTPLADVVFAPEVVDELTSRKVLTTEWVDGERLEKSSKGDVSGLCSIAMNSYLTMMLETGRLHCDPHPGNLLRTPEGKLCILDWGLIQELPADLRLSFIEHIAHLTSKDYAKVPSDLVKLGFVPEGKEDEILKTDAVDVLISVYTQLAGGGGAKKIDVNAVVNELAGLTEQYGQIFQVPPYFAYIGRSFSVLEGIGLSNDPDYSIIGECLPYIAQRLLNDPSPRTAGALNTFIFGSEKDDTGRFLDVDRVETLLQGFTSYSAAAGGAGLIRQKSREEVVEEVSDKMLELFFSPAATPLQAIVLEQLAKVVSASGRAAWRSARDRSGRSDVGGRSVLGRIVDPLGLFQRSQLFAVSYEDERALEESSKLVALLQRQSFDTQLNDLTQEEVRSLASIVVRKLWDRRGDLALTSNRLGLELLKQTANRLERSGIPGGTATLSQGQTATLSRGMGEGPHAHQGEGEAGVEVGGRRSRSRRGTASSISR